MKIINNKNLIFLFILLIASSIYASDKENLLRIGKQFYKEGKYYQAIKNLESATLFVENYDDRYDTYFYLGLSYYMIKNPKYVDAFKDAIKANPLKKLDAKILSPKIIEIYDGIKKETLKEQSRLDLVSSSLKQYVGSVSEKKSFCFLEYDNAYRKIEKIIKNDDLEINYQTELLKYEYGFYKFFSIYLGGGFGNMTFSEENSKTSFAYEGCVKGDILLINKINFDIKAEYLNLEEKFTKLNVKIKWQELRTGAAITYNMHPYFNPYIGIYHLKIRGSLDYLPDEWRTTNLVYNISNGNGSNEVLAGVKMNINNYLLQAEMRANGDFSKLIQSFKLGAGMVF